MLTNDPCMNTAMQCNVPTAGTKLNQPAANCDAPKMNAAPQKIAPEPSLSAPRKIAHEPSLSSPQKIAHFAKYPLQVHHGIPSQRHFIVGGCWNFLDCSYPDTPILQGTKQQARGNMRTWHRSLHGSKKSAKRRIPFPDPHCMRAVVH